MKGIDAAYFCVARADRPGSCDCELRSSRERNRRRNSSSLCRSDRRTASSTKQLLCRDSSIAEQVFDWSGLAVIHLRPPYFLGMAAESVAAARPAKRRSAENVQVGKGRRFTYRGG